MPLHRLPENQLTALVYRVPNFLISTMVLSVLEIFTFCQLVRMVCLIGAEYMFYRWKIVAKSLLIHASQIHSVECHREGSKRLWTLLLVKLKLSLKLNFNLKI